jgi:CrcB protein
VTTAIAFVLAAGLGALARGEIGRRFNQARALPWGTVLVNISGSFALGLLHDVGPPMITILGLGGLGAFTTFSSFARDAVALAQERHPALSFGYVIGTCAAGIGAAAAGMWLG